ncbi:MAG: tRNA-queuosine alpha-mannosyltransferase domain-containing protein [Thermodesulfobacteriota bacterium]
MSKLRILFLEPFFGGSHKDFALGWQEHSVHQIELITLPDRFWKWRMRGAALHFVPEALASEPFDALVATDMMNVGDFRAIAHKSDIPILLYFHENQLTYPEGPGEKRETRFAYINITSALAADRVLFNSRFHFNLFFQAARSMMQSVPDHCPDWIMEEILEKSGVAYPGCRFPPGKVDAASADPEPPLVVWNHRWEWDKQPDVFFSVLRGIRDADIPFRLALLGESYEKIPKVFQNAKEEFADQIAVFGYVESRCEYLDFLEKGAVTVSTAVQENFGISVVEAVRMGCFPLLPDRLSYPEIIPDRFHDQVLYSGTEDLDKKLRHLLLHSDEYDGSRKELSKSMEKFSWELMVPEYDNLVADMASKV